MITQVVIKKGGVCIYFKETLPIIHRKDLESMHETVVTEIILRRKKICLQTKAVKSLICFKKTSKTLSIILKI